ncbi:MAG: acyltransferase [Hydrogenovibrio crunogenus]|nr:acyltransferase [Hydrogenovibrio crunogenus]
MDKYKIPGVKTFEFTKIIGLDNIEFGKNIIIDDFVLVYAKEKIKIGNFVHIANFASITGGNELIVEDFAAISQGCRILTATDDFKYSGFGNSTVDNKFRNIKSAAIKIGKFCVVGANSVVLPSVTIGEGATVGANSVVTKDLQPWGIYIGNKKVGERDKEAVLANYQKFLDSSIQEQAGALFKRDYMMHYVNLKPEYRLTIGQATKVKEMELPTAEERFPFDKDAEGSHLIEVYCKGTLQECQNFIAAIEDQELRVQFEIISR